MQTGSFNYTHAPQEPWVTAYGFAQVSSDRVWPPQSRAWSRNVREAAAPSLQGARERPEDLPERVGVDRHTDVSPARGAYKVITVYLRATSLALPSLKYKKKKKKK